MFVFIKEIIILCKIDFIKVKVRISKIAIRYQCKFSSVNVVVKTCVDLLILLLLSLLLLVVYIFD